MTGVQTCALPICLLSRTLVTKSLFVEHVYEIYSPELESKVTLENHIQNNIIQFQSYSESVSSRIEMLIIDFVVLLRITSKFLFPTV